MLGMMQLRQKVEPESVRLINSSVSYCNFWPIQKKTNQHF